MNNSHWLERSIIKFKSVISFIVCPCNKGNKEKSEAAAEGRHKQSETNIT